MSMTIEEAAREAVRKEYLCETCAWKDDCDLCGGENTAFDCCECPADSYEDGFKAGAAHLMALPLAFRMNEEEKERVRKIHAKYMQQFCDTRDVAAKEYAMGHINALETIFGKELFGEE